MSNDLVYELTKNAFEVIQFRLGEFKGHKLIDMRVCAKLSGQEAPAPTKKNLAVPLSLWPQFRRALNQVDAALADAGWIDPETLY